MDLYERVIKDIHEGVLIPEVLAMSSFDFNKYYRTNHENLVRCSAWTMPREERGGVKIGFLKLENYQRDLAPEGIIEVSEEVLHQRGYDKENIPDRLTMFLDLGHQPPYIYLSKPKRKQPSKKDLEEISRELDKLLPDHLFMDK